MVLVGGLGAFVTLILKLRPSLVMVCVCACVRARVKAGLVTDCRYFLSCGARAPAVETPSRALHDANNFTIPDAAAVTESMQSYELSYRQVWLHERNHLNLDLQLNELQELWLFLWDPF